jgi:predicted DNA-binding protein
MNDERAKTNTQVTIRLTDEFRARIKSEADAQCRTESNMIKAILEEYFNTIDRAKKIAERR